MSNTQPQPGPQPNYNDPLTLAFGAIVVREAVSPGGEERITMTWPHLDFMPVIQGTRQQAAEIFMKAAMRLHQEDLTVLMLQAPGLFIPVGVASGEADYITGVGAAELRAKNAMRTLEREKWAGTATPALKHHVHMLKVTAMLSHGGRTDAIKAVSERLLPIVCSPWGHDVLDGVWRHWEGDNDDDAASKSATTATEHHAELMEVKSA